MRNINLGALAKAAIFIGVSAPMATRFQFIGYAIEQNVLWDKRRYEYQARYLEKPQDYDNTLKAYQAIVELGQSIYKSFTPEFAFLGDVQVSEYASEAGWRTVKEWAEAFAGKPLPDINPEDAIELGKTTIFSAEQWFRGCTDKRFWSK